MPGANTRPDTRTELRRIITTDPVAVSDYKTAVSVALARAVDMVADEARVNAETRHVPSRCEHATDLAHEAIELIDVGMYECHAKRVDAARSERKVMSVCAHCAVATLPGERELVYREVKSDNAPASRLKGLSRRPVSHPSSTN